MKNLGKRTGTTEANITNRVQDMEETILKIPLKKGKRNRYCSQSKS